MSHRRQTLEAISKLLSYPTETYVEAAEMLYVILQSELPEAAECMAKFGAYAEPLEVHELEENYARTFDINPACALEVGWHLFGEEYTRGLFLVRLRGEMRDRGIEESAELPDHVAHVLAVVAAMPDDEAQRFVRACVLPAVDKMCKALEDADSPYRHVVRCLAGVLEHEFGRAEPAHGDDQPAGAGLTAMPQGDPLRDFPMPCTSCEPVELVPLWMNYHDNPETSAPLPPYASLDGDAPIPVMQRGAPRQGQSHG